MRIANGVFLLIFLLSCAVQLNDPDPYLWVFYYGVAAVFAALGIANIYTPFAAIAAIAFVAGWAYSMPSWSADTLALLLKEKTMTSPEVEEAREAFGLLICAFWMAVQAIIWFRRKNNSKSDAQPKQAADSNQG